MNDRQHALIVGLTERIADCCLDEASGDELAALTITLEAFFEHILDKTFLTRGELLHALSTWTERQPAPPRDILKDNQP